MSTYKAIATVTASLRSMLQAPVQSAVAGATITMVRPDVSGTGLPTTGVNLFLFQVTPNAALRNADLPTRRADGTIFKRPGAAIDLHYLFNFYGDDSALETQRLLGAVVAALHATPALSRVQIASVIADPSLPFLADSDLAQALDLVRFTPTGLSLEELSKLWSVMLQTPYVLSVAYQAGPVILEEETDVPVAALPVRRTPVVRALATKSPVQPSIQQVLAQATSASAPAAAPVLLGYTLLVYGSFVAGVTTQVLIDGKIVSTLRSASSPISVSLASTLGLRSGKREVQVVQVVPAATKGGKAASFSSNVATFVLQPTIVSVNAPASSPPSPTVAVSLSPKVAQSQQVRLLLAAVGSPPVSARTYEVDAPLATADDEDPFSISVAAIPSGTYLVRVQVDGAESLLDFNEASGFTGPTVTL